LKLEIELVVAWLRCSLHPLLVYSLIGVYRPRDLCESDSIPCGDGRLDINCSAT